MHSVNTSLPKWLTDDVTGSRGGRLLGLWACSSVANEVRERAEVARSLRLEGFESRSQSLLYGTRKGSAMGSCPPPKVATAP